MRARRILSGLITLAAAATAAGQTNTWNGTASSQWFDVANWGSGLPVDGQIVLFNPSAPNRTINMGGGTSAILDRVQFQGSGLPEFRVENGTLRIAAGEFIRVTSNVPAGTQRVSANVQFQGSGLITNDSAAATLVVRDASIPPGEVLQTGGVGQILLDRTISGGGVTKIGSGLVLLDGENTYTGPTRILGGVLETWSLYSGGTPCGLGAAPADAGFLILDGGTLRNSNSSPDNTDRQITLGSNGGTIDAATSTTQFISSAPMSFTGPDVSRTLGLHSDVGGRGTFGMDVADSGAGQTSIRKSGPGEWVLFGENTFTGGVTVEDGRLTVLYDAEGADADYFVAPGAVLAIRHSNDSALTLGSLSGGGTVNGGTDAPNWYSNTLAVGSDNTDTTFSGGFEDLNTAENARLRLVKVGTGTLTLTGDSRHTGGTTVSAGTLHVHDGFESHYTTIDTTMIFDIDEYHHSGFLYGNGTIIKRGPGELAMEGHVNVASFIVEEGVASMRGLWLLPIGNIDLRDGLISTWYTFDRALGAGPGQIRLTGGESGLIARNDLDFSFGGGTVVWGSANFNPATLVLSSEPNGRLRLTNAINLGGANRTIRTDGRTTLNGVLSNGSLTKTGPGRLVLAAVNTYSGSTTVNGGALQVNGAIASAGACSVNNDATIHGTGTIGGTLFIHHNGTLAPGNYESDEFAVLNVAGGVWFNGNGVFAARLGGPTPGTQHDQLRVTAGDLVLRNGAVTLDLTEAAGSYSAADRICIIENTGGGQTGGYFANLPDNGAAGAVVLAMAGVGGFAEWRIYYHADCATGSLSGGNDVVLAPVAPPACPGVRGDANCDGGVNFFDIDPFLTALFDAPAYAAAYCGGATCAVDVDCSNGVDFFDIDPFLMCLFAACPPCP